MKLNQKVGTVLAAATLFFVGALSASPVFADETTSQPTSSAAPAADPVVVITTSMGKITVKLDMTKAPISTTNFIAYVKAKHYDGTIFHRVIPSFMIQGGGMTKVQNQALKPQSKMKRATASPTMKARSLWRAPTSLTARLTSFSST
jgi:hypothetical protein